MWSLAALAALPMLVLGVFFVLPVSGMVARGLWPDGRFDPGAVVAVLGRPRVHRIVWFTLWTSATGTAGSLLLGIPAAYVLYRLSFPGRRLVRALMLVPFVLPTIVVGVAFRQLLGPTGPLAAWHWDGTPVGIVMGLVFFNISVVIRGVGTAWESLSPRPAEAAAALGASPAQVLRTVTLPALRPAVISAGSIVFLFCATAFGVVLTLGGTRYATVETEIYLLTTTLLDLPAAAALSVLQLLVVTLLLGLTQRVRPTGEGQTATAHPRRCRRSDLPALIVTGGVLLFVGGPLATLVLGSFQVDHNWSAANYRGLSTTTDPAVLVPVADAMVNSLRTAVDATWMTLVVGLPIALLVTRRSRSVAERRFRSILDGVFMLPLGVSAVTLGFGFLITLDQPPLALRDSPLLVPIAQALVALPVVVRLLVPVLGGIDDRQRQVAASLGATPLRSVLTVDLPVIGRPLVAAAGLAFAISLGEFGATSFLARDEAPTLPVVIFRLLGHPGPLNYGMALAGAVLLAATTAAVMVAVEWLRVPAVGAL